MCFWNDNLDNDWFIDSGATAHMTKNGNLFSKSSRCNEQIRIADGSILKAVTIGDIDAFKKSDDGFLSFEDVLYVKDISTNLLSISKIVQKDKTVIFDKNGCKILNNSGTVVARSTEINGMYKLDAHKTCFIAKKEENVDLWHRRIAHINRRMAHKA